MTSLFNSKIFASLSIDRQNKIKSAILDPINTELVEQLSSYVSVIDDVDEPSEDNTDNTDNTENTVEPTEEGNVDDESVAEDKVAENKVAEKPATGSDISEESVEPQSEKDEPIQSCCEEPTNEEVLANIDESIESSEDGTHLNLAEIKDKLNESECTQGVTRVQFIASDMNEVWIYYKDDVNVNMVLSSVIDIISNMYSELEFNRVARSYNAIVFETQLSISSTVINLE